MQVLRERLHVLADHSVPVPASCVLVKLRAVMKKLSRFMSLLKRLSRPMHTQVLRERLHVLADDMRRAALPCFESFIKCANEVSRSSAEDGVSSICLPDVHGVLPFLSVLKKLSRPMYTRVRYVQVLREKLHVLADDMRRAERQLFVTPSTSRDLCTPRDLVAFW